MAQALGVPGLQRGQLRVWHGYSWAEPSLAAACVTQGTLQVDFGSSPFAGCQGPVGVKGGGSEWGGQNSWLVWDKTRWALSSFLQLWCCDLGQALHLFVPSFPLV